MATIAGITGNTQVPGDWQTQQMQLARRQKIADAMLGQSMAPDQGQFISNGAGTFYSGSGMLGGIGKAFQRYQADKQQKGIDADQQIMSGDYQNAMTKAVQEYAVNSKADPRGAAIQAISSSFPQLQALGKNALEEMQKGAITPKDLVAQNDPKAIAKLISDGVGGFTPKPTELKEVNGVLYNPDDRKVVALDGPNPTQKMENGDLYEQNPTTGQWKKLDNATKITNNVSSNSVTAGQKEGSKKYFDHAAAMVDKLGEVANGSQQLLNTLNTLEQLHTAGIYSNLPSGAATTLSNLGQSLGVKVDSNKLANTEAYNSLITDLWQRSVAQYGGNRGVTASEAEAIKKLTPLASSSPQARAQLFKLQKAGASRNIDAYKRANRSFADAAYNDDPRLFQIPDDFEQVYTPDEGNRPNPNITGGNSGAPIPLDQYLKGKR